MILMDGCCERHRVDRAKILDHVAYLSCYLLSELIRREWMTLN